MLKLLTTVNPGEISCPIDISKAELRFNATYVGEFCLRSSQDSNTWVNSAASVFYCANPDISKGHSRYFALFMHYGNLMIANAESAVSVPITGIIARNGEIIYSRYRHDYRVSTDGSVFIDGGRDYTRSSGSTIEMIVKDGQFYQNIERSTKNDRGDVEEISTVQI